MLPYVMEFNLPAAVEKYPVIAKQLEIGTVAEPSRVLAEKTVAVVTQLARDINIPAV